MTNSTNSQPTNANRSPNPQPGTEESARRRSGGNITPRGSPHQPTMGVPGQSAFRPFRRPHQPHWPSPGGSGGPGLTGELTPLQGAQTVPVGGGGLGATDALGAPVIGGSPSARKRARDAAADDGAEASGGNQPGEAGANTVNCSLCGREFLSPKALFGHMRSHPDRGWKGARPPPAFRAEEEFADLRVDHQEVTGDASGEAADSSRLEPETEEGEQKEEPGESKGYQLPDLNN